MTNLASQTEGDDFRMTKDGPFWNDKVEIGSAESSAT